jgi:hypothetical protein
MGKGKGRGFESGVLEPGFGVASKDDRGARAEGPRTDRTDRTDFLRVAERVFASARFCEAAWVRGFRQGRRERCGGLGAGWKSGSSAAAVQNAGARTGVPGVGRVTVCLGGSEEGSPSRAGLVASTPQAR